MRDERNVYGTFKFFVKYRLGQQFRWRVFWFNLSGKLFAGYWHSKRSQIGPNIVDICSELWGKVSHFRIGYSFAAIFFGKFPMIEFYAWLYCMPIRLVTNIEKRFMGNATGCAEKSFGLIFWQEKSWYPGKSADGYKIWQNAVGGNFQHILHICLSKRTLLSSQKNVSNLSSVTRKWILKFCIVRGKKQICSHTVFLLSVNTSLETRENSALVVVHGWIGCLTMFAK